MTELQALVLASTLMFLAGILFTIVILNIFNWDRKYTKDNFVTRTNHRDNNEEIQKAFDFYRDRLIKLEGQVQALENPEVVKKLKVKMNNKTTKVKINKKK